MRLVKFFFQFALFLFVLSPTSSYAIDEVIDTVSGQKVSPATMDLIHPLLSSCFEAAADRDQLQQTIGRTKKLVLLYGDKQKTHLIGMASCNDKDNSVHISNVCIDPGQRGKKLGKFLMKNVLMNCAQQESAFTLSVKKDNQVALKLYQDYGFQIDDLPAAGSDDEKGVHDQYAMILPWKNFKRSPTFRENIRDFLYSVAGQDYQLPDPTFFSPPEKPTVQMSSFVGFANIIERQYKQFLLLSHFSKTATDLNIPPENTKSFYGNGAHAYLATRDFIQKKLDKLESEFQNGPFSTAQEKKATCKKFKEIMDIKVFTAKKDKLKLVYKKNAVGTNLQDLSDTLAANPKTKGMKIAGKDLLEDPIIAGSSNSVNFMGAFFKHGQTNTHNIINLSTHGTVCARDSWVPEFSTLFLLSAAEQIDMEKELALRLELSAQNKNVNHFNIFTCNGAGIHQLALRLFQKGLPNLCTISASPLAEEYFVHSAYPPFETNFAHDLTQYPSQLQAFYCAMAKEEFNNPQSLIDYIVEDWEKHNPQVPECPAGVQAADVQDANPEAAVIIDPIESNLRIKLNKLFSENIKTIYDGCKLTEDQAREKNNFYSRIKACKNPDLLPAHYHEIVDLYPDPSAEPTMMSNQKGHDDLLSKHENFIKSAKLNDLLRYKDALCCLNFNLKEKEYPPGCQ